MKLLLLLVCAAFLAFAGPEKLDPFLRALLHAPPELVPALLSPYGEEGVSDPKVPVFVEFSGSPAGPWLAYLRSVVGPLATASLPLSQLVPLAGEGNVRRIWASRPIQPLLDLSVPEIGAPALWYGSPSSTGQGVIVGIVDSGVDILHPAFRLDRDGDGSLEGSRILFYWDQTAGGAGGFPAFWGDEVGEGRYGWVYSRRDLEAALRGNHSPVPDVLGHGTHVAGIAAGGPVAGRPGVAPQADLVVVKTNFFEDGVVDAVKLVFEAAEYLGKPAVVNISLGGHAGPHDGQGPFERMISGLVDRPGRVIAVAAGNEGARKIHVGGEVRSRTSWTFVPFTTSVVARFWYSLPAQFRVTVLAPTGESLALPPGQARTLPTPSGLLWLDNGLNPTHAAQQVFLSLTGASPGSSWHITFEPILPGRVDGWLESSSMGQFLESDGQMSIAEPGNAERVITVGAYVTRVSWNSEAGPYRAEGYTLYALAPFSSRGPTRDGRLKPDLAAPGAWIVSARSRDAQISPWSALPGGKHMVLAGTSMAAPHVAGACALLLSRNPTLTWQEILRRLQLGARADLHVGSVPNTSWGMGKVDLPRTWAAWEEPAPVARPWLALLANPVTGSAFFRFGLPGNMGWAELRIYDLLGRLVWKERLSVLSETARWDLQDLRGGRVASGLYLAVLVTERGRSEPVRLVVSR